MLISLTEQIPSGGTDGHSVSELSTFWCHNCCTEWPEQFCDGCGATLKTNERLGETCPGDPSRSERE